MQEQDFLIYVTPLRPTALRIGQQFFGSAEDAEDVAQETLLRLWPRSPDPDVFSAVLLAPAFAREGREELRLSRCASLVGLRHLTMLRMYALSRRNELGERLFQYPVRGTGNDVLPVAGSKSRLLLLSPDALWRHLGARPTATMNVQRYFRALERDTLATEAVRDYQLCANLIDRDLDAFVAHLKKYYPVSDSALHHLPRYYREALTLYTHLRAHPQLVYHHNVMDEDWDNMQELERTHSSKDERQTAIVKRYGDSYWYYYFWHK